MKAASDERAKLEAQLAIFVEIASVSIDEETLAYIKERVAELEKRLQQIKG